LAKAHLWVLLVAVCSALSVPSYLGLVRQAVRLVLPFPRLALVLKLHRRKV
jgi:hypothetical protein